jgi:CubicO group peptidase (beta-lactamase class C family)
MGAGVLLVDLTGDWTGDLDAGITAGVGDMTLQLPGSVGVRVDVTERVGEVTTTNLSKDGDAYVNDAYGESEVTLRFDIKASVGKINLEAEPAPVATEPEPAAEAPADEEETQAESQTEQQAAQPVITPELLAEFSAYVEQSRETFNVPGVAVAIVQGGEIVYAEGFGEKEIGGDDPVTADTIFSPGSTGKAMTAMMVASLVDDGLIEWDTPLVEVMPQFQLSDEQATQQITFREALGMTSGLPDLGPVLFVSGRPPEDYVEYLASVPLAAPPGESYVYHNEMFVVGAYAASPNHATPHFQSLNATLAETGFDVTPHHYLDMDTLAPAGTARMTAPDVGRFLITMLSGGIAPDGSRAISAANLAETWNEQIAVEPLAHLEQDGYGMGWHMATYQGIPHVTHDGHMGGFASYMAFIPEADTGIVVLANADFFGLALRTAVQYKFIELLFGLEPFMEEGMAEDLGAAVSGLSDLYSQLAAVDPETVAPFLGSYDMEGEPYTVELRDGRLWVSLGKWDYIELLAAPDGSYVAISGGEGLTGAPFQFVEADDGRITMVIFGQIEVPKLD